MAFSLLILMAFKFSPDTVPTWLLLPAFLVAVLGFLAQLLSPWWEDFQHYGALLTGGRARRLAAAQEDPRPPFLLLRSFFDSSLLRYEIPDFSRQTAGVNVDLVGPLSQAVSPHGPMLAIGGVELKTEPSRHRQIAFIDSTETNWGSIFSMIAISSRAIVLMPSITPGIFREIAAILGLDVIKKTLVFMPPAPDRPRQEDDTSFHWWKFSGERLAHLSRVQAASVLFVHWSKVQSEWRKGGLNLPDYSYDGMLFIPNRDFSPRYMYQIGDLSNLENAMNAILPHLGGSVRSTMDILDDCASLQGRN